MDRAQSPLEYLLGIGGVVLVSVVVIVLVVNVSQTGTENLEGSGGSVFESLLESGESSILRIDPSDGSPLPLGAESAGGTAAFFDSLGSPIVDGAILKGLDGDGDSSIDERTFVVAFDEPTVITQVTLSSDLTILCPTATTPCEELCLTDDDLEFRCRIQDIDVGAHELSVTSEKLGYGERIMKTLDFEAQITDDSCELIPETGPCKARFMRHYFDQQDNTCKEFIWGGCDGVVPFETTEECQTTCGGIWIEFDEELLEPWVDEEDMEDLHTKILPVQGTCSNAVLGDVDGDGRVTAVDLQRVINAVLDDDASNPCTDVDGNGQITVRDIEIEVLVILGIVHDTPTEIYTEVGICVAVHEVEGQAAPIQGARVTVSIPEVSYEGTGTTSINGRTCMARFVDLIEHAFYDITVEISADGYESRTINDLIIGGVEYDKFFDLAGPVVALVKVRDFETTDSIRGTNVVFRVIDAEDRIVFRELEVTDSMGYAWFEIPGIRDSGPLPYVEGYEVLISAHYSTQYIPVVDQMEVLKRENFSIWNGTAVEEFIGGMYDVYLIPTDYTPGTTDYPNIIIANVGVFDSETIQPIEDARVNFKVIDAGGIIIFSDAGETNSDGDVNLEIPGIREEGTLPNLEGYEVLISVGHSSYYFVLDQIHRFKTDVYGGGVGGFYDIRLIPDYSAWREDVTPDTPGPITSTMINGKYLEMEFIYTREGLENCGDVISGEFNTTEKEFRHGTVTGSEFYKARILNTNNQEIYSYTFNFENDNHPSLSQYCFTGGLLDLGKCDIRPKITLIFPCYDDIKSISVLDKETNRILCEEVVHDGC